MKKTLLILLFLSASFSSIIHAQEATKSHKDSLITIINDYYKLNLKVFQKGSKVEDIDNIFNLFTKDFTYVHPKYGGVYTREDLYNGYVRNQKNNGYNGNVTDIKIVNMIVGLNAVTVEKIFVTKKENENEEDDLQMTLFEFKNGQIFKIFEYW